MSQINYRITAATLIALIGIAAVVWTSFRLFGGPSSASSGLPQLSPEDLDGPRLYEAEPLNGEISPAELRTSLEQSISQNEALNRFSTEARSKLSHAAWAAILPILSGSFEDYKRSSEALGDPVENSADLEKQWRAFADHNPINSILSDEVVVEMFAESGRKRSFYDDGKRMIRTGFAGMGTLSNDKRFTEVSAYSQRSLDVVEARCLVQMSNKDRVFDVVLGVALAWDPVNQRWQPVEHRVYHKDDAPAIVIPPL
jgi:hypothetical protein